MRFSKGALGAVDQAAKWLVKCHSKFWAKFVVMPVLIAIPPAFITAFYSNQAVKAFVIEQIPKFAAPLQNLPLVFVGVAAIYPSVLIAIGKAISRRAETCGVHVDTILALVGALDSVVGLKLQRFQKFCSEGNLSAHDAFCAITVPTVQIQEITRAICEFFNATRRSDGKARLIRVVLARMHNGKIVELPVYFPNDEPPTITLARLNQKSAIICAARDRRIVVIESIAMELKKPERKRRFVQAESDSDNKGSLICFPVKGPSQLVPYVVSIHCDDDGYFKLSQADIYSSILERFALRLNLEYSLFCLKEKLCEPPKS